MDASVEYPVLVPVGHTDRLHYITRRVDTGQLVGITFVYVGYVLKNDRRAVTLIPRTQHDGQTGI